MPEIAIQVMLQDNGTITEGHQRCLDCRRRLKSPAARAAGRGRVCLARHEAQRAFGAHANRTTGSEVK